MYKERQKIRQSVFFLAFLRSLDYEFKKGDVLEFGVYLVGTWKYFLS